MHANDQLPLHIAAISCNLFAYSYNVYGTNSNFPPISIGAQRGTRCEPRHHRIMRVVDACWCTKISPMNITR